MDTARDLLAIIVLIFLGTGLYSGKEDMATFIERCGEKQINTTLEMNNLGLRTITVECIDAE